MAYITREDGIQFVVPSYRDVLTSRQGSVLKREILLLSQNYGEYITLQKKGSNQYEVAFSLEPGYLLGESVWHYFKRPQDMVYCEELPNTTEAIVVIVKSGSVYLDGRFPIDSIPEELVVFLTQQNEFEIYLYGDIPISKEVEEGKFSFDPKSVKSFNVLSEPVFASIPALKVYQLQLVERVLQMQGIGVFPIKKIVIAGAVIFGAWFAYSWFGRERPVVQQVTTFVSNPYQDYFRALISPDPALEINKVSDALTLLLKAPNWRPEKISYSTGTITASMLSMGGSMASLFSWVKANQGTLSITPKGISVAFNIPLTNRVQPKHIYSLDQLIGSVIDSMRTVEPGNSIEVGNIIRKDPVSRATMTVKVTGAMPTIITLIGSRLKDLPIVLEGMTFEFGQVGYNGTITFDILGN